MFAVWQTFSIKLYYVLYMYNTSYILHLKLMKILNKMYLIKFIIFSKSKMINNISNMIT